MGVLIVGFLLGTAACTGETPTVRATSAAPTGNAASVPPSAASAAGKKVCGQAILLSPYTYNGKAGSYRSGTSGLPTYGQPGTDFPSDTHGVVLPTGTQSYPSYELRPDTVYYLLPGVHVGNFQADTGDAFVGGRAAGESSVLSGDYSSSNNFAIDSNSSNGDQTGVTIEYLTVEKYLPNANAAAINQEANTEWSLLYNTITLNVPGAGVIAGAGNMLKDNCMTLNGQYGFQSTDTNAFGQDMLTDGPYGVTVEGNEISFNDTCDFSGLLNNKTIGWSNYDPVPAQYRNPECGSVQGDGDQGGFKLWRTNGVTIEDNYIHNNWGPGGWADTDNANTTWTDNVITDNEDAAIIEEISYNFSITGNYLAGNDWIDGLGNPTFPQPAIYISGSGSDTEFGGVPACSESLCDEQGSYSKQSVISGNDLVNNGGGIFLWQDSNRSCADGYDQVCTLVDGGPAGPFTLANCKANLPTAQVNTGTYAPIKTGSPAEDWWNGCTWRAVNVLVSNNTIAFDPAQITDCTQAAWPACGANGLFSEYGSPSSDKPGWVVGTELTFLQGDIWKDNTYQGPSVFYAWNQGNQISWSEWSGDVASGNKCSSAADRQGGGCSGPFGQDTGSSYTATVS